MAVALSQVFGTDAARDFIKELDSEKLNGTFATIHDRFGADIDEGLLDAVIDVRPLTPAHA